MNWLHPEVLWNASQTDRVLVILSVAITILFLFVVLFALTTIAYRLKNIRKARRWEMLEQKWEPVLLQVMAREESYNMLHKLVGKQDRLPFVDFLMRYTQHFKGEELDVLKDLARPYLPLVAEQLQDKSSEVRARAVNSLSKLGFHRYQEQIIRALDDSSPLVAMIAARALMRKDQPELATSVLRHLPRFAHWSINYLSSMIIRVGDSVTPLLRDIFNDTAYPKRTRAVCGDALRELHDFESADEAVEVLHSETDRDICATALRLLGAVGLPKHLPTIIEATGSPDFVIRAQAYRALGNIGGRTEIPVLESALDDPEPWVAIQAAHGLKEAGGSGILESLAKSEKPTAALAQQVLDESFA